MLLLRLPVFDFLFLTLIIGFATLYDINSDENRWKFRYNFSWTRCNLRQRDATNDFYFELYLKGLLGAIIVEIGVCIL